MLLLLSDRTINQDLGVNLEYCYLMADRPKRPTEQHRLRRRTQLWVWRRTSVSNERSLRCEYLIKWCAENASRNIDTARVNFLQWHKVKEMWGFPEFFCALTMWYELRDKPLPMIARYCIHWLQQSRRAYLLRLGWRRVCFHFVCRITQKRSGLRIFYRCRIKNKNMRDQLPWRKF